VLVVYEAVLEMAAPVMCKRGINRRLR
jgi:hypothetical protein